MSDIRPFKIEVSDSEIKELKTRLKNTRWPESSTLSGWEQGVPLDYAMDLINYWQADYNWKECESTLNKLPQFSTLIDEQEIVFIHKESQCKRAKPLILTHGWPGSVIEFIKILDRFYSEAIRKA